MFRIFVALVKLCVRAIYATVVAIALMGILDSFFDLLRAVAKKMGVKWLVEGLASR